MKKHKDAIRNIRSTLKILTEQKRETKKQIQALKFDADGRRRPETGPQRDQLWHDYVGSVRPRARAAHLAIGLLKGRPYKTMEPKCAENNLPLLYEIHQLIVGACEANAELKAEWTFERTRKLILEGTDPLSSQEAA